MLGSELKEKRVKSGLNQRELAEILKISTSIVSQIETGKIKMTKKIEKKMNNIFNNEYILAITNKVFSRDKFLKDMLTGNSLVDEIYIEAKWLKNLEGRTIYTRGTQKDNRFGGKKATVQAPQKQYVILDTTLFYCKEEWLNDK